MFSVILIFSCSYFVEPPSEIVQQKKDNCSQGLNRNEVPSGDCETVCKTRQCFVEMVPQQYRQYEEILVPASSFLMGCDSNSNADIIFAENIA